MFAIWDCEEFSNSPDIQWYVSGCIKDCENEDECEEFYEVEK